MPVLDIRIEKSTFASVAAGSQQVARLTVERLLRTIATDRAVLQNIRV
ncbi:MAG: hypothetical protein JWO38_274 [Gemmataceae bacterium]|nr:hypothetical protein [Gemmataceae bacterium]